MGKERKYSSYYKGEEMKRKRKFIEVGTQIVNIKNKRKRITIKIAYPNKVMDLSHLVWIASGNTIPKNHVIHHIDRDPYNNNINNLELMSRAEHASEHFNDNKRCFECKSFKKLKGTGKLKCREAKKGFCKTKNKKVCSITFVCDDFKKKNKRKKQ